MSVIEADWNYYRDINPIKKSDSEFQARICDILKNVVNSFKTQKSLNSFNDIETQDDTLENLVEINRELRQEEDKLSQEISLRLVQYENLKKDKKLLAQGITQTHEAFLMAKKYYKKYLKMYYTIVSRKDTNQIVFVQFFTEAKKDSSNFSISLLRNKGCYEILSTTPNLASLKEYQKMLEQSKNIPEVLCCIRQDFMSINGKK